jgi:hypothetical protein
MAEIVVQGNTFKIKGTEPTPKEQVAIDSVLAAKKAEGKGGLSFDDEMKLMITPEDVLSDAQKGKYNKDTESFLASPDFMRIVTEVGLSIAGGIAGVAAAPFTGGSSLVGTGLMAARVARIARPLLNLSRNKQRLIGGVTGAGLGGGAGAAISQTFDPKESIVREVARGTAQGAFGELLGFGMAGALAKTYNKVTGFSLKTIDGAQDVVRGLDGDKLFYKEIAKFKETGKLPSKEVLDKLSDETQKVFITPQQRSILESTELADDAFLSAQKGNPDFFNVKRGKYKFEDANIIAGKITEQSGVELASSLSAASIGGGAFIRNTEGLSRLMTIESIDNFTKVLTKDLPKIDYDTAADGVTAFLNSQIRGGQQIYKTTKDTLWDELAEGVTKTTIRADGTYNPAFNVKIRGPEVSPKITVTNTYKGFDESVDNLSAYIKQATKENIVPDNGDVNQMLGILNRMGDETDYNTFRLAYSEIAGMRPVGRAQSVQAEIVKRMEAMLANSPLPAAVNNARKVASDFTKLGGKAFEGKVVKDLLKSDFGQERLYKNIIGAGKPTYFRAFQKSLKNGKINAGDKQYDLFPEREQILGALQGQFFKDFLRNSVDKSGQYYKLNKPGAEKFLKDYDWLLKDDVGFLTKSQIKGIKDYTRRIQLIEGKIKPPGAAGTSGDMLVQMKQAGALSQIVGVVGFGTGTIDPGAATFFVLGPAGLAYAMSRPATTRALIEGLGKGNKGIDSYEKLTRYVGQLSSALVSEGIVGPVEAKAAMDKVQGNKEAYEQYFKTGIMPNAPATREFDPENAPAIEIDPYLQSGIKRQDSGQRTGSIVRSGSDIPLPNVTPSSLPMGGSTQQSNTELAQALNLFSKGGIVSAKKSF